MSDAPSTAQAPKPEQDTRTPQEKWEHRWQKGRTAWDRGSINPALNQWLAADAIPGPRVLIPGAGTGYEAVELARRGYDVTAIDFAPTAVARLRQQLKTAGVDAVVVEDDFFRWQPEQPVDAIYEQTSLCALEPTQWPAYEQRLHQWLRPGGALLALFMQTEQPGGPPYHCALEQMHALFPESRWRWPPVHPEPIPHPSGVVHELAQILYRL